MNDYIDSFFDTKRKRCAFIKLLCWSYWTWICFVALYTAFRLLLLNDYASLFSLLDDASMNLFFISRMVLKMMSSSQGTIFHYLYIALSTLKISEWILFGVCLFLFYYSKHKRVYLIVIAVMLGYICICSVLFLQAMSAHSLQDVAWNIKVIGGISGICFLLFLGIVICNMIRTLWQYRIAMRYHIVEILDNGDQNLDFKGV